MSDRKINMTRVRQAIVWTMLLAGIATLAVFSIRRKASEKVDGVTVSIIGVPEDKTMLTEKEVKQMLMEFAGKPLTKAGVGSLPLRKLEAKLNKDKRIERADIYIDKSGGLHVIIKQKSPLLRVANEMGDDYYLDVNGSMIPYVVGSAPRVPIVTGVKEVFTPTTLKDTTTSILKEIYGIMHKVNQDPFMASLIEQVHVTSDSIPEIVLIPKIGREQLLVGNANNLEEKFEKLKIFYKDGLPRLGWNRYKTLNLKYNSQIAGALVNPIVPKVKIMEPAIDSTSKTAIAKNQVNNASIHH